MREVAIIVGIVVLALSLSFGISAAIGYGVSWVLAHFGVNVAWYVCSVAIFLVGVIVRGMHPAKP